MKQYISFLLAIALTVILCGCQHNTDKPNPTTSPSTNDNVTSPVEKDHQIPQQPMIAASMPVTEQTHTADDGSILLRHVYQNLEIIVPDQDVAEAIILDFLNRTDKSHAAVNNLLAEAKESHSSGNLKAPFLWQSTFEPMRIDRSIFSLMGSTVTYKGYAHPEVTAQSVTYDITTGNVLTISDILQTETGLKALEELIIQKLRAQCESIPLYDGYEKIVSELFATASNWYLSENGLVFYYSPYEIAPYASGIVSAEIEYEYLVNILKDDYFPAESDLIDSQLLCSPLETDSTDRFSQIAEHIFTEGQHKTVLYTDGKLERIRIVQQQETATYTVFASPQITPNDAIVIHFAESDDIQLSYFVNGEMMTKSITLSSDGIPQLIN